MLVPSFLLIFSGLAFAFVSGLISPTLRSRCSAYTKRQQRLAEARGLATALVTRLGLSGCSNTLRYAWILEAMYDLTVTANGAAQTPLFVTAEQVHNWIVANKKYAGTYDDYTTACMDKLVASGILMRSSSYPAWPLAYAFNGRLFSTTANSATVV